MGCSSFTIAGIINTAIIWASTRETLSSGVCEQHRIDLIEQCKARSYQGCILAGISFLSISSILLPTRKSGIRRDKYLSAAIFKEAVHSDDS